METLEEKIQRVLKDEIEVVPHDPEWKELFAREKEALLSLPARGVVVRAEHFGSTAVPGLPAKPVVDILVEVSSLRRTREEVAPCLERRGYDYFLRPVFDDGKSPFYCWFIKRNASGKRTHHIHMVEADSVLWERLLFRDFLVADRRAAEEYGRVKAELSKKFRNDRVGYTSGKTEFIRAAMEKAGKQRAGAGG